MDQNQPRDLGPKPETLQEVQDGLDASEADILAGRLEYWSIMLAELRAAHERCLIPGLVDRDSSADSGPWCARGLAGGAREERF